MKIMRKIVDSQTQRDDDLNSDDRQLNDSEHEQNFNQSINITRQIVDLKTQNATLRTQQRLQQLQMKNNALTAALNTNAHTSLAQNVSIIKKKIMKSNKMRSYKNQSMSEHFK